MYFSLIADPAEASHEGARRTLSDCSRRTAITTTALTTRLSSGGKPLVRIEVVNAWITSAPMTVVPR